MRARTAFSYVEMLLVMTIIGVFAAIALPRFAHTDNRQRVDAAARRLAGDLALASTSAKASSKTIGVRFAGDSYVIEDMIDPLSATRTAYRVDLKGSPWNVDLVRSVQWSGVDISFNGHGYPSADATLTVSRDGYKRSVRVDQVSGTVSLQ